MFSIIKFYFILFTDASLDIDAFSEEFDLRMKWGRAGPNSTCSTIPRPTSHTAPPTHPPPARPGSAVQHGHPHRDYHDGGGVHRHSDIMNTSQLSDKTGKVFRRGFPSYFVYVLLGMMRHGNLFSFKPSLDVLK